MFTVILSDITSAIKFLKKITLNDNNIRYGFYCFLLVICLFLVVSKFSDGKPTLTDWISAISDFSMALAALWGVLIAKNWLSELTTKDGYQVAFNIKNKTIPSINDNIQSVIYVNGFRDTLPPLGDYERFKKNYIMFASVNFKCFREAYLKLFEINGILHRELHELETYGWRVKEDKKHRYDEIVFMTQEHLRYSHYVSEHMRKFMMIFFGTSEPEKLTEELFLDNAELSYKSLDLDWLEEMKRDITSYQMSFNMLKVILDSYQQNDPFIGKHFERLY